MTGKMVKMEYTDRQKHILSMLVNGNPLEEIARAEGITPKTAKKEVSLLLNGYRGNEDYLEKLSRKVGYASRYAYRCTLYYKKSQSFVTKVLSQYIKNGLIDMGKSQNWLAKAVGLSKISISRYCRGQTLPEDDNLKNIFRAIRSPYDNLDDLIMDVIRDTLLHQKEQEKSLQK